MKVAILFLFILSNIMHAGTIQDTSYQLLQNNIADIAIDQKEMLSNLEDLGPVEFLS